MRKRKILVFLASRGNFMILHPIMRKILESEKLDMILVVGASAVLNKYGDVIKLVEKDGFYVDEELYMIIEGETPLTMAKSTGLGLIEFSSILLKYKPDFTLVTADRYEMLSAAIASAYNNILIAHIQGGEVSGSIDESVRHAITKLSHIHFPANELSKQRILQMGEDERYVFDVGCPRIDIVKEVLNDSFDKEGFLNYMRNAGVGDIFDIDNDFILLSQHPVTTEYGQGLTQITMTLKAVKKVAQEKDLPVIALWPNADAGSDEIAKGIRIFRERGEDTKFHFFKSIPFEYYTWLMNKTLCLVGNSSSGIREGPFIGTPVVNVGSRQADRERGKNVIDTRYKFGEIKSAIERQISHGKYESETLYGEGNSAERIVRILEKIEANIQKKFVLRHFT